MYSLLQAKDVNMISAKLWNNKRYKEFEYTLYDNFQCDFDLI